MGRRGVTTVTQQTAGWVGKPLKRLEDPRLLTGRGTFIDDLRLGNVHYAGILRSPYAHAKIKGVDPSRALQLEGVVAVLTGKHVLESFDPFPVGVKEPLKYYPMAIDKVRYVGEPVALVVAKDRQTAEDALDLVQAEYEPLEPVVDVEAALEAGAPLLHENIGSNAGWHRSLVYGDPDNAFSRADFVVKEKFVYPKFVSTPLETYGIIAALDKSTGIITIHSNFQGPWTMFAVASRAMRMSEDRLRWIVPPDIGGGFGIKTSIYPYLTLLALATLKTGVPVKWIEDRKEHLMASSSGTGRVSELEVAFQNDGKMLGLKVKIFEDVGAYIRAPEPGCILRPLGNIVNAYKIRSVALDAYAVLTNKCPTGPNRGYGCDHYYFALERVVDLAADKLGLDPAEIRFRNLIQSNEFPYRTPTGGIYDAGDYPRALKKALELSNYRVLREEQKTARLEGRLIGVGIALAVDPSVSNMGYLGVAQEPQTRAGRDYLPKSGGLGSAVVKAEPSGKVTVHIDSNPQGQGHETVVAQIVSDQLGISPQDIKVVCTFDTFTTLWSISSGSYSSRFASVGTSAVALAARKLREKMFKIAAYQLDARPEDLEAEGGNVYVKSEPSRSVSFRRIVGTAHWNPTALPSDVEPGFYATQVFMVPNLMPADAGDRVNSSSTYGFIADVVTVEVDRETGSTKILKYVTVHDAGTIINPGIVEGQIHGSTLHGLAPALHQELLYDKDGQLITATLQDYFVPTAVEAVDPIIAHEPVPSPFTTLGSKGCGESNTESTPAAIANAVADALKPLGARVTELPLTTERVWKLTRGTGRR